MAAAKKGKRPATKAAPVDDASLIASARSEMEANFRTIAAIRRDRSTGRRERSIADLSRANENLARTIGLLSPSGETGAEVPPSVVVSLQFDEPRDIRVAHLGHADPAELHAACPECSGNGRTGTPDHTGVPE